MAFELEALVGHLYMAGGRLIYTQPPGALAQVAPRTAARGREIDTFFALVLPSGQVVPTSFYEQMAQLSAERYFSTTGSVTSALRDVFNTLNNNLYEHNQSGRRHYEANMICAVLRDNELFIARSGASAALLRHSGETLTLPDELASDEKLFLPPMGIQPIPNVEMKRFKVDSGSRLILVDAAIAELQPERVTQTLVAENIERVLDEFKTLITLQTQLLAIEFVPPDTQVPVITAEGESSRALSASISQARQSYQAETARAAALRQQRGRGVQIQERVRQGAGDAAKGAGNSLTALADVISKLFRRKDAERGRFSGAALTMAVFAFPLAIVLVVVLSWIGGLGETAFESCVNDALQSAETARAIDSSQPNAVRDTWTITLGIVEECEALRPGDPVMTEIRREGQEIVDRLSSITRRQVRLIDSLPGASIKRLILQGKDLYVLDTALNVVYRVQLDTEGLSRVGASEVVRSLREGATVDGLTLGPLIDITVSEQNLLAFGRNGVLISCRLSIINQCAAQQLDVSRMGSPIAIDVYSRNVNFYVLDPGANQIWRFQPSGGLYTEAPRQYFTGTSLPPLVNAVDFAIKQDVGEVFVLYNQGFITRHFGGDPQNFGFAGFPDGQEPSDVGLQRMHMNESILPAIYLVSQGTRTIFETGLSGIYQRTYRINDETLFELLSDVTVDPAQRILYAASGNAIFAMQMEE